MVSDKTKKLLLITLTTCCLLAGFAALFPDLFSGKTCIFPGDLLFRYDPWESEFLNQNSEVSNWILFDEVLEFYPWRQFMAQSIKSGKIPLWDPASFCGYPFIALFQSAFLYLPDRMMDILDFPLFTIFRALFHIIVAGWGTALFLRGQQRSLPSAVMGAILFAFSGFMMVWLGHPHMKTAAWLPWLFRSFDQTMRGYSGGSVRLAVVSIFILSSGHIETALHIFTIIIVYGVIESIIQRVHHLKQYYFQIIISLVIAGLTLSAMVLPFLEYLVRSVAYATRVDGVVTQAYFDKILMITHILPDLFGNSADGNYWYRGFNTCEIGGGFVGVLILSLMMTSLTSIKSIRKYFVHLLIIFFCWTIVYKIYPFYIAIEKIPGFKMSYNFRMVLPLIFSTIFIGTGILDDLFDDPKYWFRRYMVVSSVMIMIVFSVYTWLPIIPGFPGLTHADTHTVVTFGLIPLIAGLLLLATTTIPLLFSNRTKWVILIIAALEVISYAHHFNPVVKKSILDFHPQSANILSNDKNRDPFRTLPIDYTYPPHINRLYSIHDIRGNDALTPLNIENLVELGDQSIREKHKLPALRMMWITEPLSSIWNLLNIKYVVFPSEYRVPFQYGSLQFESRVGSLQIYKNKDVLKRAFFPDGWQVLSSDEQILRAMDTHHYSAQKMAYIYKDCFQNIQDQQSDIEKEKERYVKFIEYKPHYINLETHTKSPRLLVLSDTYFPGWQVQIDDRDATVLRVNHALRGVMVSAGSHRVKFYYRPTSFLLGTFLSLLGLMTLIVFSIMLGGGHKVRYQ